MMQLAATIQKNINMGGAYWRCVLKAPAIAKLAQPGQFINVSVSETAEPLLRRPLGIHRVSGSTIEMLYEVVGQGTRLLSRRAPGEILDIIGPLGNGFTYSTLNTQDAIPILIAGGMGVAPLVFLAEKLAAFRRQKSKSKILVLLGARTRTHLLCEKEMLELGCIVKVATDDGSKGFKGHVTDLLPEVLSTIDQTHPAVADRPVPRLLRGPSTIFACGPHPMLKAVARLAKEAHIPAQVSLEEHMACGIGACLGCVVATRSGMKRVCKEGPVFDAQHILWE
ncbi:MAG: dihydroorotate dehydrogenase electron transfer subunit [Candidatus Omnitrophica bacterium]|nr:dihydroorotate dehydrogenase electron transfer subunit [Candidatus Omnitrophota bacterium]